MAIQFQCHGRLSQSPDEITDQILDLALWPQFGGAWPIPGIATAEFETRTPEVVGTRIRVVNRDRSSHVEEIVAWQPGRHVQLRMAHFSPPLCWIASHFLETWHLERDGVETRVTRSFALHPQQAWGVPILWTISFLLRRAIRQHLRLMATQGNGSRS